MSALKILCRHGRGKKFVDGSKCLKCHVARLEEATALLERALEKMKEDGERDHNYCGCLYCRMGRFLTPATKTAT